MRAAALGTSPYHRHTPSRVFSRRTYGAAATTLHATRYWVTMRATYASHAVLPALHTATCLPCPPTTAATVWHFTRRCSAAITVPHCRLLTPLLRCRAAAAVPRGAHWRASRTARAACFTAPLRASTTAFAAAYCCGRACAGGCTPPLALLRITAPRGAHPIPAAVRPAHRTTAARAR